MRKFTNILVVGLVLLLAQIAIQAQLTTGSISGTVTDPQGAVVPGATVTVTGENGQTYTATTNGEGVYEIPGVQAGTPKYTVTITAPNFKTSVIRNVKVDVSTPATVNTTLQAGKIEETVVVTSGAEVLQSSTSTIGSTIQGRQILETPISTRNALDLVTLLPGTNVVGVARTSSINGLPKTALTIQVDGVDVQDEFLKSSDGFFTFIQPKLDAIDEVTVSTSNPGAESTGDGAVGIKFQTRRGTDTYRGTAFFQHRDESLNATNVQNDYLGLPKQKLRLNQFGFSFGGPIPFLNFGEGVPWYSSGKGSRYFFIDYERYHLNEVSPTRVRQVLTSEAQGGLYRYGAGGASTVNLFTLAAAAGLPSTIDPTVANILNTIRTAAGTAGTFSPTGLGGIYYRQQYQFTNPGDQRRRFLAVRTDFNIMKDHALEIIFNDQPFRAPVDFLNSFDPTFPGIANSGAQNSERRSLSIGLRSNFGSKVINEFRYAQLAGWLKGSTRFDLVGGTAFFTNTQGGYSLSLGAGLTSPTIRNGFSSRVSPVKDFTDNVTWVMGNHTINFGGELKKAETISDSVSPVVSTVGFGVATTDSTVLSAISSATLPGATAAEVSNAQSLYAALTGRVTSYGSTVYLGPTGQYQLNGSRHFWIEENTDGVFVQDAWRIRPNFSITGGIRWQPVLGTKMNTADYAILNNFNMVYDVSGPGNIFTPGTLTGVVPTVRGNTIGEKAFPDEWNNWAPSVGFVWSPEFRGGFLKGLFGRNGDSVFRGGFSRSYIREGTLIVENSLGLNPGGSFSNNRATSLGNLTVGTLFQTPGNPNLVAPAFNATPVYPRTLTSADEAMAFSPNLKTGYVDSYSFGYQRQIGKDTVVEVRYVGNRGQQQQTQYSINEINAIENGFGTEFALAQQNLIANINAGRGANFRYFGVGTGTNPLPIMMSYLGNNNLDPSLTTSYSSSLWANSTFVNLLSPANPGVQSFAATMESNFRATATTNGSFRAGRPLNFINNCPTTLGFCFIFDNSKKSWYDSGVIEFRRRLSAGIRIQASYVYGRAFSNDFSSAGTLLFGLGAGDQSNASNNSLRKRSLDTTPAQVDIRHAFKFDATWDLPFGKGRRFLSWSNWASDAVFGGWSFMPVVRWQSGSPILMENVSLVGMTAQDLQKLVGVYYNQTIVQPTGATSIANVTYLPAAVINNTIRAFTTTGSNVTGYGVGQAPTGQFIAPAGYGDCMYRSVSEVCGYRKLVIYGPSFFKFDATLAKRIPIGETHSVELRLSAYDVLNRTNWRLGGWTGNVNNITAFTGTFGQMQSGWSYQDPSGSNDPGGRVLDLMIRFNF